MKTLLLVRHASSGCDDMSLADRFRPVDARGERELAWLSRCGRGHAGQLQWIASSPAVRALATARVLAEATGLHAEQIRIEAGLYDGGSRRLLELVADLDDRLSHAAVVAHNPELADLARYFDSAITHLPSAAIAVLRFDHCTWREAARSRAAHAWIDAPPRLAALSRRPLLHGTSP